MSSAEPATSVFVSTSRDHPLHLWDAFTGSLRATYRAYDHLDEVVAANSVCFNTNGDKIFAGTRIPGWNFSIVRTHSRDVSIVLFVVPTYVQFHTAGVVTVYVYSCVLSFPAC